MRNSQCTYLPVLISTLDLQANLSCLAAAGSVVPKQLPLHPTAGRQPLDTPWEKGVLIPFPWVSPGTRQWVSSHLCWLFCQRRWEDADESFCPTQECPPQLPGRCTTYHTPAPHCCFLAQRSGAGPVWVVKPTLPTLDMPYGKFATRAPPVCSNHRHQRAQDWALTASMNASASRLHFLGRKHQCERDSSRGDRIPIFEFFIEIHIVQNKSMDISPYLFSQTCRNSDSNCSV